MRILLVSLIFSSAASAQTAPPMRPDVAGWETAVTSDHPLASAAGAEVLRKGGNAIDAAVTMAAVLSVVRPHMNGPGGAGFSLYREARTGTGSRRPAGLSFRGRSPWRLPARGPCIPEAPLRQPADTP